MTRKELIESREYLKTTIDVLLNGLKKKQRKKVRNTIINFILDHRAEYVFQRLLEWESDGMIVCDDKTVTN
jgi:hypothetical protein